MGTMDKGAVCMFMSMRQHRSLIHSPFSLLHPHPESASVKPLNSNTSIGGTFPPPPAQAVTFYTTVISSTVDNGQGQALDPSGAGLEPQLQRIISHVTLSKLFQLSKSLFAYL